MPSHHHDPAERAGEIHKKGGNHLNLRKRLRKQAEREYPGRKVAWYGGILYFEKSNGQEGEPAEVPGVQRVPKPGTQTVGYYGSQIAPPRTQYEAPYRSSYKPSAPSFGSGSSWSSSSRW